MAWYQVSYQPQIVDDLAAVDPGMAQRIVDKTKWLASNADNLRHEAFEGSLPALHKYAVGDWRIVYSIDRGEHVVTIHLIGQRQQLYG
jgi:mRNA interferase RelE/StbE